MACDGDDTTGPTTERFTATLNGANERPEPRTTPGTGTASFTFRSDTLRWTINMANMTNIPAAHIHDGVAPTNTGPGDFPAGEIRGQVQKVI